MNDTLSADLLNGLLTNLPDYAFAATAVAMLVILLRDNKKQEQFNTASSERHNSQEKQMIKLEVAVEHLVGEFREFRQEMRDDHKEFKEKFKEIDGQFNKIDGQFHEIRLELRDIRSDIKVLAYKLDDQEARTTKLELREADKTLKSKQA